MSILKKGQKRAKGPNETCGASKRDLGPNFWNLFPKGPTWQPCPHRFPIDILDNETKISFIVEGSESEKSQRQKRKISHKFCIWNSSNELFVR